MIISEVVDFFKTLYFVPYYSGGKQPQFVEEDVFRCFIPVNPQFFGDDGVKTTTTDQVVVQVTDQGNEGGPSTTTGANDTLSCIRDTVNDTVSDTVKNRLARMIDVIRERPGLKSPNLAVLLEVTEVTVRQDI